MSYANGTATGPVDLLQQLVTFLVAAGWTQDASAAEGAGWAAHLHNSGNYVHLRGTVNETVFQQHTGGGSYALALYLGTSYNSGQPWNNQTAGAPIGNGASYPVGAAAVLSVGPFTNYYFMTDSGGQNVVVIVEVTPGVFSFVGWGPSINAAGSITGGAYFYGSASGFFSSFAGTGAGYTTTSDCPGGVADIESGVCAYLRCDVDSFTGKWIGIGPNTSALEGYTGKVGSSSVSTHGGSGISAVPVYATGVGNAGDFQNLQTSAQDSRANLLPVLLWVNRDSTTTGFSLAGSLPMVFSSNGVGNGFSNASEYTIGSDTYKMFPNFAVLKVP
jgi:hypothetical protein